MPRLTLLAIVLFALPIAAQDTPLFPRFSLIGGSSAAEFETNVRIDPEAGSSVGTLVTFERDLGLEDSKPLPRFELQWRPFARHELAATHFSASRAGFEEIDREIVFRDQVYPVRADVATEFELDYWSLTYTYWLRRAERDGFGLTLGAAKLGFDVSITATREDSSVTLSQEADTDVPVALAGLQGRVAFTNRLHGEASVATLPSVTIGDYTGSALTGQARLEFRPLRWLGVGAAYDYFKLDVDVAQVDLRGALEMTVRGPQAYVRLAF